jgi:predicted HTH transcriptional regulator
MAPALQAYYLALRQTQGAIRSETPDWQPWLRFFLRAMQQQMRRLADKVEREKLLVAAMPVLALAIVDHARNHGRVTMGEAVKLTGASRNTLKGHLRMLVERRHLLQHGVGRGAWYSLP